MFDIWTQTARQTTDFEYIGVTLNNKNEIHDKKERKAKDCVHVWKSIQFEIVTGPGLDLQNVKNRVPFERKSFY